MKVLLIFAALALTLACVGCGGTNQPTLAAQTVVFVGDSISFFWSQSEDFGSLNWTDKGVVGTTSDITLANFQQDVIAQRPDVVHILTGTNDVYPGWNLDGSGTRPFTINNIMEMVLEAKTAGITPVLGTIPPWGNGPFAQADTTPERFDRINQLNNWIIQFGAAEHIAVVDYHALLVDPANQQNYLPAYTSDGVHPNKTGYDVMTPVAEGILRR